MPSKANWGQSMTIDANQGAKGASTHKRDAYHRSLWVTRRKLAENARSSVGAAAGNVVNAFVSTLLFADSLDPTLIVTFWACLVALIGWRTGIGFRVVHAARDLDQLNRLKIELIGTAIGLGALWGTAVAVMLAMGPPDHMVFGGIIGAGMMSAGAISYRTIPIAAIGYVIACVPGSAAGLILHGSEATLSALGLLVCFLGVLTVNIRYTAKRFAISSQREQELARSRNTIRLLLNDHIEQGADWLISVDRDGRIVEPSKRLASAVQRPVETLEGYRLADLLDPNEAMQEMREIARAGGALRNHIVSLTVNGEQRWWSISGRAIREGNIVYRGVVTDVTAQRRAEEKVSYMAHYDGLTDLPNRFLFHERLYRTLHRDRKAALLFLDLDHFKAVNDTLGHAFGDKLLQVAARRIEGSIGKRAMLARLGGDEFAILLTGARIKDADLVARKVIEALGNRFTLDDHDVVVGVTIGIALAPQDGDNVETLLRNADLALYAAKNMGRNRAARYEPGMDKAAQERRLLELDLRGALGKGEMRLHYQPLVSTVTGETTGYEALVRWVHPERGTVMPGEFIPVAEDTGLIVQLGEWVIRQALDDVRYWDEKLSVSINLSPAQMRSPALIGTILSAIASSGVNPARICFEITESVLMQDSDANIDTLHKLREIGVQIALDDFGTGYSSLNYLRSFPFSKIKIDRCFVSEIDSREDCRAIIRSVVHLANSLGMETTAEGVEREEQVHHLRAEGCGEVQGYLYSKALPVDQLTDLRSDERRHQPIVPFEKPDTHKPASAAPAPRRQTRAS